MGSAEFLAHRLVLVVQVKIRLTVHIPQRGDDQRSAFLFVISHQQDAFLVKAVGQRVVIQAVLFQPFPVRAQVVGREHLLKFFGDGDGSANVAERVGFSQRGHGKNERQQKRSAQDQKKFARHRRASLRIAAMKAMASLAKYTAVRGGRLILTYFCPHFNHKAHL